MNSYMPTVTADNTQGQYLLRLLSQQGMQQQQPQDQCIESMQQQQNQDIHMTMMQQLQQQRTNFPSLINSSSNISATTNIKQPTNTSGATSVEPSVSLTTSSNNAMSTNITTSTSNANDINIHDIMALRSIEHTNELLTQKLESIRQGHMANPIGTHQHLNEQE